MKLDWSKFRSVRSKIMLPGIEDKRWLHDPTDDEVINAIKSIPTHRAPALVSHVNCGHASSGTLTSSAIDTTGASLLIMNCAYLTSSGITVADSKTNTWTALTSQVASNGTLAMFYAVNPTVGTGHTFSCTSGFFSFTAASFSGISLSNPLDVQNGAGSAAASTIQSGSITPTQNNELIVFGGLGANGGGTETFSVDSSLIITDQESGASSFGNMLSYLVQGTAAAINPTLTSSVFSTRIAAAISSFKQTGGSPSSAPWWAYSQGVI